MADARIASNKLGIDCGDALCQPALNFSTGALVAVGHWWPQLPVPVRLSQQLLRPVL